MGERHVEELFSAAYDGALSDTERARYEAHLAGCERCTAAAAEFRTAIDAVRALPQAQMPVRVVLPATPPVAEHRRFLPAWLRLPVLSPATGGAVMALVGIAAVVVAVHVHGGGSSAGSSLGSTALKQLAPANGERISGADSGRLADIGACPKPLAITTARPGATSAGTPAGFSNRVAITNPQRPGEELVLATTSGRYAPGAQVLVFAALTTSGNQHTVVVPCVALQEQPTENFSLAQGASAASPTATAAGGGSAGAIQVAPNAAPPAEAQAGPDGGYGFYSYDRALGGVPLAIAFPTSQSVAGTVTVQVVTIPDTVPHGTVLHLVALIPAGVPGSFDKPAIEAVLTLDVS
jgi:hypothetical protein